MTTFRNATLPELKLILDWAAAEGWNPGLDDAEAFYQADPDGFFVAENAKDEIVAAISVVNHSDDFAFLGLYIVRPDERGKGIGLGLWQYALNHASGRTVGLDGVEAQLHNYIAPVFSHAVGTTRFSGNVQGAVDPGIRLANSKDIPWMIEQETTASGVAKPDYLYAWFTPTETRSSLILEKADRPSAFCTVRQCRSGAKIGPLIAENSADANRLIAHAATMVECPVTLDVPETSTGLIDLCSQRHMNAGFKTARMYCGSFSVSRHTHFAVSSLELG